jgi:hypothetical protein
MLPMNQPAPATKQLCNPFFRDMRKTEFVGPIPFRRTDRFSRKLTRRVWGPELLSSLESLSQFYRQNRCSLSWLRFSPGEVM